MDTSENSKVEDGNGKTRGDKPKIAGPFYSLHNLESEESETSDNEVDDDRKIGKSKAREKTKKVAKPRREPNPEKKTTPPKRPSPKRPLDKEEKEISTAVKAPTPPAEDSDSVGSSSGRSDQSASAVLLLKPPRKKFLKCGVFNANSTTSAPAEPLSLLWTSALRKYQMMKPNLTDEEFILPYDYWWTLRYQKEFTLLNPSEEYRKIRSNIYFDAKPVIGIKSDCGCTASDCCGKDCMNRMLFIECDPDKCPCGDKCTNNRMQKREWLQSIEMIKCGDKGAGVKATARIEKGTFICEYVGEVISHKTFKDRMATWYKDCKHHYALTLDAVTLIDAYRCGNIARFLNHSCDPNCEMVKWSVNGFYRMGIFAMRDIEPGEELCFDYKFHAFNKSQVCLCQSEHCRGLVNNGTSEERQRKSKPKRSEEQGNLTGDIRSRGIDFHSLLKATSRREKLIAIRGRVFLNRNVDCERQKLKAKVEVETTTQAVVDDAVKIDAMKRYLSERRDAHRHWRLLQKAGSNIAQLKKLIGLARYLRAVVSKAARTRPRKSSFVKQTSSEQTGNDKANETISVDALVYNAETGRYSTVAAFDEDVSKLIGQLKLKFATTADENRESISLIEKSYQYKKSVLVEPTENDGPNGSEPDKYYWAANVPLVGTFDFDDGAEPFWAKKGNTFDEQEDKLHCVCGDFIESGFMIQCERCFYWQHCDCVNVDPKVTNYICEFCTSGKSVLFKEILMNPQPKDLLQGCVYYQTLVQDGFQIRTDEFVYVKRNVDQSFRLLLANLDFNYDASNVSLNTSARSLVSNNLEPEDDTDDSDKAVNFRTIYRRGDLEIFRVERLFIEPKGNRFVFGRYFVRPHETHCESNHLFCRNEVCDSSLYDTLPLDVVVGRCLVLDASTYCQGRPKCPRYPEEDIFVCNYRLGRQQGLYKRMRVGRVSLISKKPYVFETFEKKLTVKRDFTPFTNKVAENSRRLSSDHSRSTSMTGSPIKKESIDEENAEMTVVAVRSARLARIKRNHLEQIVEKVWKH